MCGIAGALLRLALAVAAVAAVLAGAFELGLRAAGAGPRAAAELSHVVPDGWTGFRLRPGVSGEEAFVTNDLGMHAPRSYTLARPPESLRVAVLGSSVVYGMAMGFADTIPAVVERELQAAGHRAEVLNFGTHAFTIVNLSALLQAYVHQFQPDVVVVVVDLQVGLPALARRPPGRGVGRRGDREARLVGGAPQARLREERPARPLRRSPAGAPVDPARHRPAPPAAGRGPAPRRQPEARSPLPVPAAPTAAAQPDRELAARTSAPTRRGASVSWPRRWPRWRPSPPRRRIALYFVTPYGPYFDLTDDELARA